MAALPLVEAAAYAIAARAVITISDLLLQWKNSFPIRPIPRLPVVRRGDFMVGNDNIYDFLGDQLGLS